MKKLIVIICLMASSFFCQFAISSNISEVHAATISTRKDIIVWKYKTKNGKLYMRKFNQSTGHWIGKWVRA